jgi:hypothetical protein
VQYWSWGEEDVAAVLQPADPWDFLKRLADLEALARWYAKEA